MAKFKNILSGEEKVASSKKEALDYFREKDETITRFHIKSVVIFSSENDENDNAHLYTKKKTKSNGKKEQSNETEG